MILWLPLPHVQLEVWFGHFDLVWFGLIGFGLVWLGKLNSEITKLNQRKNFPKPSEIIALAILSPNQLKFSKLVAHERRYKLIRKIIKPNQTDKFFSKTTRNISPVHTESKSVQTFEIGCTF